MSSRNPMLLIAALLLVGVPVLGAYTLRTPSRAASASHPDWTTGGRYTFYVGLTDPDTGAEVMPADAARARLNALAAEHAGGFTVWSAQGGWTSTTGEVVTEPTLVYAVLNITEAQALALAEAMRAALGQHSVLIEYAPAAFRFHEKPASATD